MEANQEKNLQELPESQSNFWQGDKHSKEIVHKECDHSFVHKSAREIECEKCRAGFVLTNKWHIKNKKLYYKDKLVF